MEVADCEQPGSCQKLEPLAVPAEDVKGEFLLQAEPS